MSETSSVLLTIVSVVTGFVVKWATDTLEDRRLTKRQREARKEARRDFLQQRQTDFQRQNLLDVQEASMSLMRSAATQHHADTMAFRQTGKWQGHLLPEAVSDDCAAAQRATTTLAVRIRDVEVRRLVDELKGTCVGLTRTTGSDEADRLLASAVRIHDALNRRIGDVLRNLDQEDNSAAQG